MVHSECGYLLVATQGGEKGGGSNNQSGYLKQIHNIDMSI